MEKNELVEKYFDFIKQQHLWTARSQSNLRGYLEYLFKGVSFKGARMLDIGGGSGFFVFYAACAGAKRAVCLEPQASGSGDGIVETFARLQTGLPEASQVQCLPVTFQDFDPAGEKFDIILLHNSINHLDPHACENLLRDDSAVEIYRHIFGKLSQLANHGAKLVVVDCSRYNFFGSLGLKNPVAPNISWHRHQSPKCWARLLSEVGFCNPKIRWLYFSQLGTPGRVLLANRFAAFFLASHFCLTMDKK